MSERLARIDGALEAYEAECAELGKRFSSLRITSQDQDVLLLAEYTMDLSRAAEKLAQQLRAAASVHDVRD